jgi:hypothetical protein
VIEAFLNRVKDDPRISTAHVSLYASLCYLWIQKGMDGPLSFFSHELRGICKISSHSTFHKTIRELNAFGYIEYLPSYNHFLGSLVYFKELI